MAFQMNSETPHRGNRLSTPRVSWSSDAVFGCLWHPLRFAAPRGDMEGEAPLHKDVHVPAGRASQSSPSSQYGVSKPLMYTL